jgi:hypothetical protein
MICSMNRNSPVPLWAVLCVGFVVLGGAYVFAQRMVAPPQPGVTVSHPTAPQPIVSATTVPSTNVLPRNSAAGTTQTTRTEIASRPTESPASTAFNQLTPQPSSSDTTAHSSGSNPCTQGLAEYDFGSPSSWAAYSNPEDFYSIRYPNLGTFNVRYAARPRRTILGWNGVGCGWIEIYYIDSAGLTFRDWIAKHAPPSAGDQELRINGMNAIVEYLPQADSIQVYLERRMDDGSPLVYEVEFDGSSQQPLPFWRDMLNSFLPLPIAS